MITGKTIQSEKSLREQISKNLRKEIHGHTKPSIDFIKKILDDAYKDKLAYDVTDMRSAILTFAMKSNNNAAYCVKQIKEMKFVGQEQTIDQAPVSEDNTPLVFFDVEVFSNLFVVCWKVEGSETVTRMVNPTARDIEPLFSMKLVGFNNRRYDNHIIYGRFQGYSLDELYRLSQKIIVEKHARDYYFGEAFNLSYADIYDILSEKQGLKKLQIDLGIHHLELDIPWDKPVPEEMWPRVVEYCVNDVISLEVVFEARRQDFVARQLIAELSGLPVNSTTQQHTAKIIFGDEKNPQKMFNYPDLSEEFPGYHFDGMQSTYHGEITGEGGYVYAEPGIYENVALLDVASMHPTTIERLDLFGPFTHRFSELKEARMAIKRKDHDQAKTLLDGRLGKFLGDDKAAEELAYALKIVINTVYGLTSARFPNPFRDGRNKDNVVAKRGALFMIDLKEAVQELGYKVVHIKTDSIKVPLLMDGEETIVQDIIDFGKKYGYDFEHEVTYDWFCLVNNAVYIARKGDQWTAVGAQFQHPYVFKKLLQGVEPGFDDFCETKNVMKGTMYLDFEKTGEVESMIHVGRTGVFVPVVDDGRPNAGAQLWRIGEDGRKGAVAGTKNHLWITRDMAIKREVEGTLIVDMGYFDKLLQEATDAITQFDGVNGLDMSGLGGLGYFMSLPRTNQEE